jgi:2-polyprenyl-3-methyl-5-hydroxy-6-metoxy-1,4-benzoquinol methylase
MPVKSKNNSDKIILDHYKKVASNHLFDPNSTIQDPRIREAEVSFICSEIDRFLANTLKNKNEINLLDAGCGNGYLLSVISKKFPNINLYGIEFTPELLELGKKRELQKTKIVLGDIRHSLTNFEESSVEKFDIIISERVIINLLEHSEQRKALSNINDHLLDNGVYVQVESFFEPLVNLNRARKEMALTPIEPSEHNKFLNNYMIGFMRDCLGLREVESSMPTNYLSTYFFLSRVFHQVTRPPGGKVKFSHMVDFLTEGIGPAIGNYSPILFKVFKKFTPTYPKNEPPFQR